MNNAAIIYYDEDFTVFNEFLFKIGRLNDKYITEEIIIEKKNIKIYKIPITLKNITNKKKLHLIMKKFVLFLKERNINKIIISDKVNKMINIKEYLKENFFIFNGKNIIKYKFSYIIKRCLKNYENIKEIVFFSNNFNIFYDYFNIVFKNYRIQTLVTDYKNMFLSFVDEIYNEYGLMISIKNKNEFILKNNQFIINTDMELKKDYFDLDMNSLSLIFSQNGIFKEFYKYIKVSDEKSTEFLIYCMSEGLEKSNITDFFTRYNIRIVKINKK